jgi:hypothetical protein
MTTFITTVGGTLISEWFQFAGGPAQNLDANPTITITSLGTGTVVLGPTAVGVGHPAVGVYTYTWTAGVTPDNYIVVWNGLSATDPVQASEIVNVLAAASGGVGPCAWELGSGCSPDWDTYSTQLKADATAYATLVLWSATGRQFGLCPMTVYPCGRDYSGYGWGDGAWGWSWYEGTFVPYIWGGQWFNAYCGCGLPSCFACKPRCAAYLPGPVASIVQVTLNGVVIDPSTYRVWDQQWLTRKSDTTTPAADVCWPRCQSFNAISPAFEVIYLRGTPVPVALMSAAKTLAGEYAKACLGQDCQLPSRVVNIARQGVTVSLQDIDTLLRDGFTGIVTVDQVIHQLNPHSLKSRTRLYSPDVQNARVITS